jgi:hypothetical protein
MLRPYPRRRWLLAAAAVAAFGLSGCVAYPYDGYYGGGTYPGYPAYAYAPPPVVGGVVIGGGCCWGGWGWWHGGWRR